MSHAVPLPRAAPTELADRRALLRALLCSPPSSKSYPGAIRRRGAIPRRLPRNRNPPLLPLPFSCAARFAGAADPATPRAPSLPLPSAPPTPAQPVPGLVCPQRRPTPNAARTRPRVPSTPPARGARLRPRRCQPELTVGRERRRMGNDDVFLFGSLSGFENVFDNVRLHIGMSVAAAGLYICSPRPAGRAFADCRPSLRGSMEQTARARRARFRRAPTPVLPEELVVWEILVRLPAKALLRCRAACRSWHLHTSAAEFLLAHHRRQPSLPLISFRGQSRTNTVETALDGFDLWRSPAERRPVLRFKNFRNLHLYMVHASCDGLVVVSHSMRRYRCHYICNPTTRQWISLPNLTYRSELVGLYPHSSSGEYRILYFNREGLIDRNTLCYVLAVGSSMASRGVGMWMNAPRDNINRTESHLAPINPRIDDNNWADSHLVQINGTLGISRTNRSGTMMKLWMLQNYEAEVWSMKYQIEFPVVEMSGIANSSRFHAMFLSENGGVLIYCYQRPNLFHSDCTGKLLQKFQWDDVFSQPTGKWFKESLVQHAFFNGKDGHCANKPPIFQGL
ncbi:hypothetical protein PR202_ga07158 [Eleusine coracana subsp. coracana]|uniref:F-box protein At3g26010-like beta-propeller domain-containing protein n=1 Tax=Eleusine coracana subsp. coracana TaxID=191504 RepID=A0AAV5BWY9_ELECO|nr:hypothetical protein PR202_ga07158 [Eleusine coracana subsp. coracana]